MQTCEAEHANKAGPPKKIHVDGGDSKSAHKLKNGSSSQSAMRDGMSACERTGVQCILCLKSKMGWGGGLLFFTMTY